MFPPFPQELARHYCQEFITGIEDGSVQIKQISRPSTDRQGHGFMVGALVCTNTTGERVVLYAVSGIAYEVVSTSSTATASVVPEPVEGPQKIIVPPIVSPEQIEKALEKNDKEIHEITNKINAFTVPEPVEGPQLKERRTQLTTESLLNVFSLYTFTRFDGKKITLNEIIALHGGRLPPTGTGDCCAPKLLSYAFEHNLIPLSMDEVFYGKDSPNKKCGQSYPPCDERCGYILPSILGLEILYRDESILVVNKQSGLLSVPGRTPDKQDCIESRMKTLFPFTNELNQPAVHRLDMETSGIMILAFTKEAHRELNRQFEAKEVHKKYVALLDGVLLKADGEAAPKQGEKTGRIELKFRLDPDNRPHQIYDEEYGKLGITDWENLGQVTYRAPDGSARKATRVLFMPQTGRTHQLRLHSSDIHGFHLPIIGDTLYGTCEPGERLMLHASEIWFHHPITGQEMHLVSTSPLCK